MDVLAKRVTQAMKACLLNTRVDRDEGRARGHRGDVRRRRRQGRREANRSSIVCSSAVGRRPNSKIPGLESNARRTSTNAASSSSTSRCRTDEPSIFAIGDLVGEPMLAHKASHEGRVAVEVIAGENVAFDAARDSRRRVHRSGDGLVRPDRGASHGGRPRTSWSRNFRGARRVARSRSTGRTADQADSRSGERAHPRRRPGRCRRGRVDRGGRAGDRDGCERDRSRSSRSIRIRR